MLIAFYSGSSNHIFPYNFHTIMFFTTSHLPTIMIIIIIIILLQVINKLQLSKVLECPGTGSSGKK